MLLLTLKLLLAMFNYAVTKKQPVPSFMEKSRQFMNGAKSYQHPKEDRQHNHPSFYPHMEHEPCCMCISSIVWCGFHTVYYFFPYHITSEQGIPHDINTMHELWGVNSYRKQNKYVSTECLMDLIANLDDSVPEKEELRSLQEELIGIYDKLSCKYHSEKANNTDNTLVLG